MKIPGLSKPEEQTNSEAVADLKDAMEEMKQDKAQTIVNPVQTVDETGTPEKEKPATDTEILQGILEVQVATFQLLERAFPIEAEAVSVDPKPKSKKKHGVNRKQDVVNSNGNTEPE